MEAYRALELTVYSVLRILPYLLLMLYIFKGSLRFPKWVTVFAVLLITAMRALCSFLLYFNGERLANANPGFLLLVIFTFLLIKDHFGKSLFSLLMLNNISCFIVTAAKYLESLFSLEYAVQLHRWTNIITLLTVEAAVLIPLFFYIKYIYLRALKQDISKNTWRLIWLVPFTFYAVWFRNSFYATENHELLSLEFIYVFFCFLVNGGGMLIYTLVVHLINERAENDRLRENELQLTIKQKQYDSLKERIEEARTARHDMRQHLHMLSALVSDKKYEELEAYIKKYGNSVCASSTVIYCKHYGINALLQYFSGFSGEHGIGFSAHVELPEDIGIPDDVLAVLLGNLLENATEACMSETAPLISVRGKMDGNMLFFKIINSSTKEIKKSPNGLYLSTKHEGRGIGLRSVRSIVNDYNGILQIEQKDGLFTVAVLVKEPYRE